MTNTVLLVTIEDNNNLGNRLQHYALQHTLKKCTFEVDSLMVKPLPVSTKIEIKNIMRKLLVSVGFKKYKLGLGQGNRTLKFLVFNKSHISNTIRMTVNEVRQTDWGKYSCAVTGSDQVWHNWHNKYITNELSYYYLEFIDEVKRVSYAPSFGFTSFPPEDIEQHRRGLMGMHALSCREQEGCELIRELTGCEVQKVLDPTLLLTADEWSEIEKKPHFKLPEKYLLQFFLGEVTPEYQAELKRIAEERGLQILNINDKNDPKHYAIGPDEFVWLVHHADTICTDSFHATVFSITFERNLRVFHREQNGFKDMFGRLHDLLTPLGLMELVYGRGDGLSTALGEEAKKYLMKEREVSLQYLKENLNRNEN